MTVGKLIRTGGLGYERRQKKREERQKLEAEAHKCYLPDAEGYILNSVWECDECKNQWIRTLQHSYPVWRKKIFKIKPSKKKGNTIDKIDN